MHTSRESSQPIGGTSVVRSLPARTWFGVVAIIGTLIVQLGCPSDKPCTTCPPASADTLTTYERELVDGQEPAISPDGAKIAYMYEGDIFVCDTSGENVVQLTTGSERDILPRWHPEGQMIGFVRSPGSFERGTIYTVPASGGAAQQLSAHEFPADSQDFMSRKYGLIAVPIWDWSPDARYVAFLTQVEHERFLTVFSTENDSIVLHRRLTELADFVSFAWSLKPENIAFVARDVNPNREVHLENLLTREEIVDSSSSSPKFIFRAPTTEKFVYDSSGVVETNFLSVLGQYPTSSSLGLKYSPNEEVFVYEWPGLVPGPLGYSFSQLFIYSKVIGREYQLTKRGEINQHSYFFERGHSSEEVYFKRFGKIVKTTFQLPP